MIIQLLPLGYIGLANPIWENTRQVLAHAIVGSIGVDTDAGLLGLIQYAAVLATPRDHGGDAQSVNSGPGTVCADDCDNCDLSVCGRARTGDVESSLAFALTILLAIVVVRSKSILGALPPSQQLCSSSARQLSGSNMAAWQPIQSLLTLDTTSVELSRRILADTPWFGCGAGCFAFWRIFIKYRPSQRAKTAATAAAKIAIELGPPAFWTMQLARDSRVTSGCTQTRPRSFYPWSGLSHGLAAT